jgi:para-aminobenzoate synthetase / 4-amino-4-deoxychorismate lyase
MRIAIGFENRPLLFEHPETLISCRRLSDLSAALQEIETALDRGFYAAGFLSYEAGYAFENRLREERAWDFPLLMMGIYRPPQAHPLNFKSSDHWRIEDLRLKISERDFSVDIERIRDFIARGEVYQITYCAQFHFGFRGDPQDLYAWLLRRQRVPYPAYIEADDFQILSLSPERFIRKMASRVLVEPMKGTWHRGGSLLPDLWERYRFSRDGKNRAENIMIADLLRNDLGRIGGRVAWPKLFTIARYATLFQMTSTVTAEIPEKIRMTDLLAALFPSGSVTGAPKIRAMQIIRQLEREPRRIYTGAIGYITPRRDLYFNVPIRTLLLRNGSGEMGVGGGIVWDSTPQGEWDEIHLKARFLKEAAAEGGERGSLSARAAMV